MFSHYKKGHSYLDHSRLNNRIQESEKTDIWGGARESSFNSEIMGDKQEDRKIDSHNSNFALVNYESKVEDNHSEEKSVTTSVSMESMEWTDYLEVIIILALAIYVINKIRQVMARKKKKEDIKQKMMINQLQNGISTIPTQTTSNFSPIPLTQSTNTLAPIPLNPTRLMIESTGEGRNKRATSSFTIYEPPQ